VPAVSRTDKTRPWWVQLMDAPGGTFPVRPGSPREWTHPGPPSGCRWTGTSDFWLHRPEGLGSREWGEYRRTERRRDRRRARRELRAYVR
jgi:hypothetical protein